MDYPSFKLVLVGDGGTGEAIDLVVSSLSVALQRCRTFDKLCPSCHLAGKTTYVKRHITGEFEKRYEREQQIFTFFFLEWIDLGFLEEGIDLLLFKMLA